MAWNIPSEGTPYYRPVEPITPVAPREPQGERLGGNLLTAMTQAAIARERAQLEQQQQLLTADLQAKELGLRQEKLGQDYELGKQELGLKSKYYDTLATNASTNATRAQSALERITQQARDRADFEQQISKLSSDVDARAKELGINDPESQTRNPIGFAAAIQKIKGEFPNAPLYTGIPDRFKAWQAIADQQTIPVKYGAQYDSEEKVWRGGETRQRPIWQVYRDLHNPDTQETTIDALAAMGHLKTEPSGTVPISGTLKNAKWYQRSSFSADVPETTTTWDGVVANIIKQGDKADWKPGVSRMPTFVPKGTRGQAVKFGDKIYDPRTSAAGRASQTDVTAAVDAVGNEAPLPDPDLPPDNTVSSAAPPDEPTQTDVLLQQARRAAGMPNADVEGIKGWLRQNNIDPDQL
jgi:hypothetical protein